MHATTSLSTHVLNTATGLPAVGVGVCLSRWTENTSSLLEQSATDEDGRNRFKVELTPGTYILRFETARVFEEDGYLYPWVEIPFVVRGDREHLHIPLLLSPFGFTTYRGS